MRDCPDDTELAGFLNEVLPVDRLGLVGGHVDHCPQCQARLDRLTDHTSSPVVQFKERSAGASPGARGGDTNIIRGKHPAPGGPSPLCALPRVRGYEIVGELGRSATGTVYKARHQRLNRFVALKLFHASEANPQFVERLLSAAAVLARVRHPQVAQVYEIDTYPGPNGAPVPYVATELLEGGSLGRWLKQGAAHTDATRWPAPRVAAELIEVVARAVHAAHMQGVVHSNLKPGNILFGTEFGTKDVISSRSLLLPKVTDFALTSAVRDSGTDRTPYTAPESGRGARGEPAGGSPPEMTSGRPATPEADVYALGAILFECLAGGPPSTETELLAAGAPRALCAVAMKCLETDPSRRYASAEDLAADLRRFLDNRRVHAQPVGVFGCAWLWSKRNPAVAISLAALLTILVALAFAAL
jgi:serine/threonine protein kinase